MANNSQTDGSRRVYGPAYWDQTDIDLDFTEVQFSDCNDGMNDTQKREAIIDELLLKDKLSHAVPIDDVLSPEPLKSISQTECSESPRFSALSPELSSSERNKNLNNLLQLFEDLGMDFTFNAPSLSHGTASDKISGPGSKYVTTTDSTHRGNRHGFYQALQTSEDLDRRYFWPTTLPQSSRQQGIPETDDESDVSDDDDDDDEDDDYMRPKSPPKLPEVKRDILHNYPAKIIMVKPADPDAFQALNDERVSTSPEETKKQNEVRGGPQEKYRPGGPEIDCTAARGKRSVKKQVRGLFRRLLSAVYCCVKVPNYDYIY